MEKSIEIPIGNIALPGILTLPDSAHSIVLFVHGSGSSRFSQRNMFVARELQKQQLATLLMDLLTEQEDEVYETRFDIGLLTRRLHDVLRFVQRETTESFPIGLFGASTGAAAALMAAAEDGSPVRAVVSRGGRPDLAHDALPKVASPTLLIVGGDDTEVLELNRQALERLQCEKALEIIPGATHLFEEPGALEKVAALAAAWFTKYLHQ